MEGSLTAEILITELLRTELSKEGNSLSLIIFYGGAIKVSKKFARDLLANKQVMATDGTEIGMLSNIVMEIKGGNLIDLIVIPNENLDTSRYKKEDEYILLPFTSVSAIKDYIIIDKMKTRSDN